MAKILSKLRGGDRRSIGKVGEVVSAVRKKPDLFNDLVTGLFDEDPVQLKNPSQKKQSRRDGTKMKNEKQEDRWVWVVVQNPGDQEQFLGQYDKQEDISFIPTFNSKEDAQQCFMNMARQKGSKYEVQAILYEELA